MSHAKRGYNKRRPRNVETQQKMSIDNRRKTVGNVVLAGLGLMPHSVRPAERRAANDAHQSAVVRWYSSFELHPALVFLFHGERKRSGAPSTTFSLAHLLLTLQLSAISNQRAVNDLPYSAGYAPAARSTQHLHLGLARLALAMVRQKELFWTPRDLDELRVLCHPLFYGIADVNNTAATELGCELDLQLFYDLHFDRPPHVIKYNPDRFSGLTWYVPVEASPGDPDFEGVDLADGRPHWVCTVTIFHNGTCRFLFSKSPDAIRHYTPLIAEYIRKHCGVKK